MPDLLPADRLEFSMSTLMLRRQAAALAAAALLAPASALAQDFYIVSPLPVVVPSALEPNIVFTLDDSVGMRNAFHQDVDAFPTVSGTNYNALSGCSGQLTINASNPISTRCPYNTRRFKSAAFNAMYYNPNVTYRVPPNAVATSFSNALNHGFYDGGNAWKINLGNQYRPTLTYDAGFPANSPSQSHVYADHFSADLGNGANKVGTNSATGNATAYYYVYDPANPTSMPGGNCTGGNVAITNDACYRLVVVASNSGPGGSDERQNFANWYSYYRTRSLAAISAASIAASDNLLQGARVAWQGLNACNTLSNASNTCPGYSGTGTASSPLNRLEEFNPTRRNDLYAWLRRLPASGADADLRAAMRRAGEFYSTASNVASNNPYLVFPQGAPLGVASNPQYACRPNFHVLVTGNAWTGTGTATCGATGTCGNQDSAGTPRNLPDGQAYPPSGSLSAPVNAGRPFTDATGDTLADVAWYYWATDLRGDLANDKLPPFFRDRSGADALAQYFAPANDPARWQHMSNYIIGVGLARALNDPSVVWTGNSFSGAGYSALLSGTAWPSTATDTGRMYDLWHAALNSRGQFFPSDSPDQVPDAISASLSRALERANIGAAIATNSSRLTTTSTLYQASYATQVSAGASQAYDTTWTGQLKAIAVNTDGSVGNTVWSATLPAAASRNILTASGPTTGMAFTWSALSAAGLGTRFDSDATVAQNLVNYLRGDPTLEQRNGGTFRNRPTVPLADIVNSEIVFSYGENFGYDVLTEGLPASTSPYATFLATKGNRTPMLYVGANGGMVHAFDANTGVEVFSYVPRALLNERISVSDQRSVLAQLANPGYTHRFYADGSPWIGDAHLGGSWRTVLLGSTGAGGPGVFAIDVTASSGTPTVGNSNVLWDLDGASDPDLGYTIGQPVIGRLPDGNWYAVFGNGYRSSRECAVLYLVQLGTGVVRRISTTEGNLGTNNSATACGAGANPVFNGLGRPSLYSSQDNRITDTIYAADLLGNVWRFNVSSATAGSWDVGLTSGNNRIPLFTAINSNSQRQPITGTIEIGRAPSSLSGVMLYFGTGRLFAVDDRTDTRVQSFYGVYDDLANNRNSALTRSSLVQRTINATTRGIAPATGEPATVPYSASGNSQRFGFYMDLPASGERVVTLPLLLPGRLLFATAIPSADPCDEGGSSWIQALDAFNGTSFSTSLFTATANITFASSGDAVNPNVGIIRNLIAIDGGNKVYLFAGGSGIGGQGSNLAKVDMLPYSATGGVTRGRTSWREVNR